MYAMSIISPPDPEIYAGHTGTIRRALFCRRDKYIVSAAEDRTIRLWDRSARGAEVQRVEFDAHPNSIELSADGNIITVAHGSSVSFFETDTLKKLKEITVPTIVSAASLHPDKHIFVCGGEDFKMYKYDYITGNEIESFKGHFGPVHAVSFSPDGELYASGSEDGTLRLWQTTVGKTYGLWKCTEPGEMPALAAASSSASGSTAGSVGASPTQQQQPPPSQPPREAVSAN